MKVTVVFAAEICSEEKQVETVVEARMKELGCEIVRLTQSNTLIPFEAYHDRIFGG